MLYARALHGEVLGSTNRQSLLLQSTPKKKKKDMYFKVSTWTNILGETFQWVRYHAACQKRVQGDAFLHVVNIYDPGGFKTLRIKAQF